MKLGWLWRGAALALLAAWAAGLAAATVQLAAWDREVVQLLLQMRADRAFRVRMAERREAIPREWYRNKALALLAAGDELQEDGRWTMFVPGAWPRFDDLRQRLARRVEREFSEIAVDTIRRELDFQAGQIAGVPRHAVTGELLAAGDCADPVPAPSFFQSAIPAGDVPELRSVLAHLDAIEQLDRAVQALAQLQSPGAGDGAEPLRLLVRYALGADVPGQLSHSAMLVRQALRPAEQAQHGARMSRLQAAVRCSLAKRMALLDARMFERNDLLASEQALAASLAELWRPGAAQRPLPDTLARWEGAVALIGAQQRLLAADSGWLKGANRGLGPAHDAVLARVERIGLLGPDSARQLRRQSGALLQRLRLQLAKSLGAGGDPGIVWMEAEGRFALSPQRLALRDQLSGLLREPFMAARGDATFPQEAPGAVAWDPQRLESALSLAQARQRFAVEQLPAFPRAARVAVLRVVERQLARQVEHAAAQALSVAHPEMPPDLASWRAQRLQAARVQALLAQLGAHDRAQRLRTLLADDVAARLGAAERALAQSDLSSPRLQDFGWWSGEGSPVLAALGVADTLTLRLVLAQQVGRLGVAAHQVAPLLEEGSVAGDPAVLRWRAAAGELERYRAGRGEGSLAVLERALLAGAEINAANCFDKVATWPPSAGADPFAERYRQLRDALARRCGPLRAAPRPVPVPQPPAAAFPSG